MNTQLPISTVIYLLRGPHGFEEILLGSKAATPKAIKRKIAGKLIGYGGDFESEKDKTVAHCAQRELDEESGLRAELSDLDAIARVQINDENGPRLTLYYYFLRNWKGEARESDEILNARWYPSRPLSSNVLAADKLVLPRALQGKKLAGFVTYDKDMEIVDYRLDAVESIE